MYFYLNQVSPNIPCLKVFRLCLLKNFGLKVDFICEFCIFNEKKCIYLLQKFDHSFEEEKKQIGGSAQSQICVLTACHPMQSNYHNNYCVNWTQRVLIIFSSTWKQLSKGKPTLRFGSHCINLSNYWRKSTLSP